METVTKALVLRSVDYRDADCILTLFTEDMGRITAAARGCRRKASTLAGGCQLLCWSEMELSRRAGRYTVQSATSLRDFPGIRLDLEKLALACYFSEVMELMTLEGEPSPEQLALILNCLHALDRMDRPPDQVKAVFELRALCISGFEPLLTSCTVCGRQDPKKVRFHLRDGAFCCAECGPPDPDSITLDDDTLNTLRYIAWCEPRRLLAFRTSGVPLRRLCQATERFFLSQMQRGFRTLDYYHQIRPEEPPR